MHLPREVSALKHLSHVLFFGLASLLANSHGASTILSSRLVCKTATPRAGLAFSVVQKKKLEKHKAHGKFPSYQQSSHTSGCFFIWLVSVLQLKSWSWLCSGGWHIQGMQRSHMSKTQTPNQAPARPVEVQGTAAFCVSFHFFCSARCACSPHPCTSASQTWTADFVILRWLAVLNSMGTNWIYHYLCLEYDRIWWNKIKLTELNKIFPSMYLKTKQGAKSWVHPACACFKQKRLLQYRHLEILKRGNVMLSIGWHWINSILAESTPLTKSKTCPKQTFGPVDKRILVNAQDSINYWHGRYGRELSCRRIHESVDLLLDMAVLWGPWVPSKAYPLTSRLLAASEIASSFLQRESAHHIIWYVISHHNI